MTQKYCLKQQNARMGKKYINTRQRAEILWHQFIFSINESISRKQNSIKTLNANQK